MKQPSSDLEKLEALYEEWSRGDLSSTDIFDADVESFSVGVSPEPPGEVKGQAQLGEAMANWLSAWERPLAVIPEEFVQSGDRILVLIRWKGRGRGSGVEMEAEGAHLWTFRGGLAVRFDVYRDRDEARAALQAE